MTNVFADTDNTSQDDRLAEFVGDGKKYATAEAALASVPAAQEHISNLETELQTLRDEVSKGKTMEDVLQEIKVARTTETSTTIPVAPEVVDSAAIEGMVDSRFDQRVKVGAEQKNLNAVNSQMTERFGTKASDVVSSKANELNMTVDQLKDIARTSPNAFLSWFPDTAANVATTHEQISSSVSDDAVDQNTAAPTTGTNAWYRALRKSNPTTYYSQKMQIQMNQDAKTKGAEFYA